MVASSGELESLKESDENSILEETTAAKLQSKSIQIRSLKRRQTEPETHESLRLPSQPISSDPLNTQPSSGNLYISESPRKRVSLAPAKEP